MKTTSPLRPLTLSAVLLSLMTVAAPALAIESAAPAAQRWLLRAAQGEYLLEDGRMLKVLIGARGVGVGLDEAPLETWRAETKELLVSPDGLRRVRLLRNADGTVNVVQLETDRLR
jgi:hypothetical protein